jgi:hypothetical protein
VEFWKVTSTASGIVITCRGHDKDGTVAAAVADFERLVPPAERFTIIADLREMTGYESEARRAWQKAFRNHKDRVEALVLVGAQSALIRMGAAAVGAFAAIPVRFVDKWDDVPGAVRQRK